MIDYARSLLGTPFHHQGRVPGVGLDCMGVLVCLAKHLGLPPHDLVGYPRSPDGTSIDRGLRLSLEPVEPKLVQPGDILSFWIRRPGLVQHCALATNLGLIHAVAERRQVVEHGMDERWQHRLATCYKLPGVEDYTEPYRWAYDPTTPPPELVRRITRDPNCCGD